MIALQGRPDRASERLLCYGTSTVSLQGGRVVSWYRGDTPLKARESKEIAFDQAATFTIGSTKAEVIAVQGPPQHSSDSVFQYGSSVVEFQNDRVVRWRSAFPALKAHRVVEAAFGRSAVFTIGSSREEVIAIQGRPDSASDSLLQYGTATVQLRDGRVVSWQDRLGILRSRLISVAGGPGQALSFLTKLSFW